MKLSFISAIADPVHVSDVISVFFQVPKPIISSRIIHFQVTQINNRVAFTVFMFILNILVKQIKFQCNGGSISRRNLTITLSIDISNSGQCKVIHTSSDLHLFWHPPNSKNYLNTDSQLLRRYILAFSIEN